MRASERGETTTHLEGRCAVVRARPDARVLLAVCIGCVFVVGFVLDRSWTEAGSAETRGAQFVAGADVSIQIEPAPRETSQRAQAVRWSRRASSALDRNESAREAPDARRERESEFRAELLALSHADRAACLERAESLAAGAGPECARSAVLRLAYEEDWPELEALFLRSHASGAAKDGCVSAASGFVEWLAERASREERARAVLMLAASSTGSELEHPVRVRALRACVLGAPEEELDGFLRRVQYDTDLHSAGLAALSERATADLTPMHEETP